MISLKLFQWHSAAFFALATCLAILPARAQMAPGAGGYNSEFGTDYRVGMARRAAVRAPIFVVGMRVRTSSGAPQNWIAPRFAAALAEKLDSVSGASATAPQIDDALAQRGLRFTEIGGGALNDAARKTAPPNAMTLRHALLGLQREYARRATRQVAKNGVAQFMAVGEAPLSALAGDIALNGPLANPSTTITVSLRLVQLTRAPQGAPLFITLSAPSRDWAQLSARCVLALCDALPISLNAAQRNALLRSASPLTPAASSARLRYEKRVGEVIVEAQGAQFLFAQAQNASGAAREKSRKNAAVVARRAQNALRVLASAPPLPPGDRAAAKEIARSARAWLAPLEQIARAAPQESSASLKSAAAQKSAAAHKAR